MEKGQIDVGVLIVLFIGVVFAMALITPIFKIQNTMTTKQVTSNQSNDVSSAYLTNITVNTTKELTVYTQSDWKIKKCPLDSVVIRNGAGTILVSGTDYTLNASKGTYTLLDTANTYPATSLNLTYSDYTYCADGYNTDSGSRSIAGFIGLFSVLALLGFIIWKSGVADLRF